MLFLLEEVLGYFTAGITVDSFSGKTSLWALALAVTIPLVLTSLEQPYPPRETVQYPLLWNSQYSFLQKEIASRVHT